MQDPADTKVIGYKITARCNGVQVYYHPQEWISWVRDGGIIMNKQKTLKVYHKEFDAINSGDSYLTDLRILRVEECEVDPQTLQEKK